MNCPHKSHVVSSSRWRLFGSFLHWRKLPESLHFWRTHSQRFLGCVKTDDVFAETRKINTNAAKDQKLYGNSHFLVLSVQHLRTVHLEEGLCTKKVLTWVIHTTLKVYDKFYGEIKKFRVKWRFGTPILSLEVFFVFRRKMLSMKSKRGCKMRNTKTGSVLSGGQTLASRREIGPVGASKLKKSVKKIWLTAPPKWNKINCLRRGEKRLSNTSDSAYIPVWTCRNRSEFLRVQSDEYI